MLPGVKLDALTAWIPILNVSLATKQLMMGQANTGLLAIVYGSSLLLALVALAFCSHWFNKESVLFRS
jgi:sodium transport system permease protein